jgi:hypothetical protein
MKCFRLDFEGKQQYNEEAYRMPMADSEFVQWSKADSIKAARAAKHFSDKTRARPFDSCSRMYVKMFLKDNLPRSTSMIPWSSTEGGVPEKIFLSTDLTNISSDPSEEWTLDLNRLYDTIGAFFTLILSFFGLENMSGRSL